MTAILEMRRILAEKTLSAREIERRSGVGKCLVLSWMHHKRTPRLDTLEAVMNAMGYRIEFVKDERQ